ARSSATPPTSSRERTTVRPSGSTRSSRPRTPIARCSARAPASWSKRSRPSSDSSAPFAEPVLAHELLHHLPRHLGNRGGARHGSLGLFENRFEVGALEGVVRVATRDTKRYDLVARLRGSNGRACIHRQRSERPLRHHEQALHGIAQLAHVLRPSVG